MLLTVKNRLFMAAMTKKQKIQFAVMCFLGLVAIPTMAATTGTEFQAMADMVIGWVEGYLGILLAVTALTIGIAAGVMKSTIMPAIVGIAVALACVMGPGIIQGIFTAVI